MENESYKHNAVPLKHLLIWANRELGRTDSTANKEYKIGVCNMIEAALHWCRQYHGFAFIDNNDSKIDTLGYYSRVYIGSSQV